MTEYDLISKRALLKHLGMAIKCEDCPRNADKDLFKCVFRTSYEACTCTEISNICCAIGDFEEQPVKHGEWDFQGYQLFKCTNCKEIFTQNQLEAMQNHINQEEFTFPNFCPNCGADMRGDTNE